MDSNGNRRDAYRRATTRDVEAFIAVVGRERDDMQLCIRVECEFRTQVQRDKAVFEKYYLLAYHYRILRYYPDN